MVASRLRLVLPFAGIAIALASAPAASAHERREVGPYEVVVGWWQEPAFAYQPNGPEVTITRGGDPVNEGVELEIEVRFGEASQTYALEPGFVVGVFGDEGNYRADLVPTRPGSYTYHLTGTVEGEQIDEEFTSGPESFSDIEDPGEVAFPAADPNAAELAASLDRERDRAEALESDVSSARTFAFAGTGAALLALIVAGVALSRAGKRPTS